jgi:hypothetical protein
MLRIAVLSLALASFVPLGFSNVVWAYSQYSVDKDFTN